MIMHRLLGSILALLISTSGFAAADGIIKKRVLSDLEFIRHVFEVKYAPLAWKNEFSKWELNQAIDEAKAKIQSLPEPTIKECQVILRDFFNTTRDYHAGVRFYSTEMANLPFLIQRAEGRYFVSFVDRSQVSTKEFPFEVGDEILTFNGQPIKKVIEELRQQEFGLNTLETDQALAELNLTFRRGDMANVVPSGSVTVAGKQKQTNKNLSAQLKWNYIGEHIRDMSKFEHPVQWLVKKEETLKNSLQINEFFNKFMVSHFWDPAAIKALQVNNHTIGARSSYIPVLGAEKVWTSESDNFFDAYIFESSSGKKIGYIRIAHYIGEKDEVEEFGSIMNYFQDHTDALVIDQINNPGGSLFYLYGLVSTLADKPFFTPKHRIALTQGEVNMALTLLPYLEWIRNSEEARGALGETMEGYPIDYEFIKLMKQFCYFIVDQWNEGKLFSDPTYLYGFNELKPHSDYRYSKPILLLVNSLDFSGGDFFPSILQDNKRATIMGVRTAGAGGYVINVEYPNHSGIKNFNLTGSIALRKDQKPIENLGVEPDVHYHLSVKDVQDGYKEYAAAIVTAVENLISKK